jgi:hypothetical protein
LIFPDIGNFIIPTDFHISQRGRYTTNQIHVGAASLSTWRMSLGPWK